MNQILFSVIGFLMFAIVGIGAAEVKIQMAKEGRLANEARESSGSRSGADTDSDVDSDSGTQTSATAETGEAQLESNVVLPPTTVPEALSQVIRTVSTALTSDRSGDSSESYREDGDDEYEDEDEWEDEVEDEEHEKSSVTTASKTNVSSGATQPSSGTMQPTPTTPTVTAFTMAQVATHNSAVSCYSAIEGTVYDLTSFVSKHPGGQSAIKSLCGVDGTAAFSSQHGGQGKPSSVLVQYKIGIVH